MVAGSGDNCNSLAGMGVFSAGAGGGRTGAGGDGGDVMVSLGTSDTLLGVTMDPNPTTTGVVYSKVFFGLSSLTNLLFVFFLFPLLCFLIIL